MQGTIVFLDVLLVFYNQTDPEFVRLLGYRFDNDFFTDDDIRDIYSGQEYRKLTVYSLVAC